MNTPQAQLTEHEAIKAYLAGGKATFTLVSRKTGARFTYRARKGDHTTFYELLIGPDNTESYLYIGHAATSHLAPSNSVPSPSKAALTWFLRRLHQDGDLSDIEFWHSGRCSKCGRLLTDPESIRAGMGPKCRSTQT
jgi:hypothetical protein